MKKHIRSLPGLVLLLMLGGCATAPGGHPIYVPAGGDSKQEGTEPGQTSSDSGEKPASTDNRQAQPKRPVSSPSHQARSEPPSAVAVSLMKEADQLMSQGEASVALSRLERAQRISPRAPAVYYKLAQAYVKMEQMGAAEQFTLRGLSLAGNDTRLQKAGWMLLADIRRASGNLAGADQAEARASTL